MTDPRADAAVAGRHRPGLAEVGELRLRLGLRRLRGTGGAAQGLAHVVLALLSIPIAAVFAVLVAYGSYRAASAARELEAAVTLSIILFAIWQTWTAVGLTMGERDGLDLRRLLVYPIPPGRLYLLGLAASLLADPFAAFWLLMLAGVLAGAALARPGPWLLLLGVVLATFAAATVTLVGLGQELLARVARRRHWREVAALAAIVGWLGIVFSASLGAPALRASRPLLRVVRWLLYPAALATEATLRLFRHDPAHALPWVALLAAAAAASGWAAYRLALGTARSEGAGPALPLRRDAGQRTPWVPEWIGPLLEKELLSLGRQPAARIQIVVLPALAALLGWKAPFAGRPGVADLLAVVPLLALAAYVHVVLQGFWANGLGWERAGARALFLAPVRMERVLAAKNLALAIYAAALFALSAAAYVITAGPPQAWVAAGAIALHAALAPVLYGAGNVIGTLMPRAVAFGAQRTPVPPLAGLVAMAITSGTLAVFAIPALLAVSAGVPWAVPTAWGVMGALGALAWWLTLPASARLLARRRDAVLAAVCGDDV